MLLITIFVELRVVGRRSRTRAGSPQAVSRRPCYPVALKRTAWSEYRMASVNQTRPHCVNQMGKTHSKPSAACYVWIGLKGANMSWISVLNSITKKDCWLTLKCCISFTHPCLLYIHFKSSGHEPDGRRPNNALHCAHFVGVNASVVLRRCQHKVSTYLRYLKQSF
jgi:hypothetical protein